jgi:hypothetical protein
MRNGTIVYEDNCHSIIPRIVDLQECVGSENLKSTPKRTPIRELG